MTDDGIALTSITHPVERHWAKRLWGWLWPSDINPAAVEDVVIDIPDQTHLNWPIDNTSLLWDPTPLERAAEMMRAHAYLSERTKPDDRLHWRRQPQWCSERDFERQQERSYFSWRVTLIHPS